MFDNKYLLSTTELLNEDTKKANKLLDGIREKIKLKTVKGSDLKNVVTKMYQSDANSLANEVMSIGELTRLIILVGLPTAISPVIGLFAFIADRAIKDNANAKVIDKYIKQYEKEIEKTEKAIDKCKDSKRKKYLEEYLADTKRGLNNLESKKYELDDKDKGIVYSKLKSVNDEMELNDAVNLMEMYYNTLTKEQKILLFDKSIDEKYLISEAFDKTKQVVKNTKHDIDAKADKMDRWFNKTARDIRFGFTNNARDDIIEQNIPKASKLIKRAIILGVTWAINPAIAVIGAMTTLALSKKGKETQRKRILRELNSELEIIEEKIKDADANSDKKKKYELMRLKQSILNNRDKIKRTVDI